MAQKVRLSDTAVSAFETEVRELAEDPEGHGLDSDETSAYRALHQSLDYEKNTLVMPDDPALADRMASTLTDISNTQDAIAEGEGDADPSMRKFARAAARATSTVSSRLMRHAEELRTGTGGGRHARVQEKEQGRLRAGGGEAWNVPPPPKDPREEIAATHGASGATKEGTGMMRTFRGASPDFLKERQSHAMKEMERESAAPHPDPGVHNAYMAHLADMAVSARDELLRQQGPGGRSKPEPIGQPRAQQPALPGTGAGFNKPVQEGERGGRYYVSGTGQKVYVKNNPGAEVVGHMRAQRFHQGLPVSAHLSEPRKR